MTGSVEDEFEIQQLVRRYNHAIDIANFDAWVDCFTEDGIFERGSGRFVSRAELRKFTERFKERRLRMPDIRHRASSTLTDVHGDRAISCSYVQLLTTGKGDSVTAPVIPFPF